MRATIIYNLMLVDDLATNLHENLKNCCDYYYLIRTYEFGTGKSRLSIIIKTKIECDSIFGHTSTMLSVNGLTNIPIHIRKNSRHVIIPRVENPKQSRCKVRGRDVGVSAEFVGALGFPDYVITEDVK
jgi:hypothetical protein